MDFWYSQGYFDQILHNFKLKFRMDNWITFANVKEFKEQTLIKL